jgi:hypothetical protein
MTDYLTENRSKGWVSVSEDAPDFVKKYVREFRASRVENRCFNPVVLQATLGGVEQRSAVARAALRTVNRIFPTTKRPAAAPSSADAVLRSIANRQAVELHNDQKVLARARRDAEEKRNAEELATAVKAENARLFPWERG